MCELSYYFESYSYLILHKIKYKDTEIKQRTFRELTQTSIHLMLFLTFDSLASNIKIFSNFDLLKSFFLCGDAYNNFAILHLSSSKPIILKHVESHQILTINNDITYFLSFKNY